MIQRLQFEKSGKAVYISHLDTARVFIRAVRRAGIRAAYSGGFNPRMKINFAFPLSVYTASECELLDIELEEGEDITGKMALLNAFLPEGFRVTEIYPPERKFKEICSAEYKILIQHERPPGIVHAVGGLMEREEIAAEKKTADKSKKVDIKPLIHGVRCEIPENASGIAAVSVKCAASAERYLNPELFVGALRETVPDIIAADITRRAFYDAEGKLFR